MNKNLTEYVFPAVVAAVVAVLVFLVAEIKPAVGATLGGAAAGACVAAGYAIGRNTGCWLCHWPEYRLLARHDDRNYRRPGGGYRRIIRHDAMSDTMKHAAVCFFLAITVMAVARIMRTWMPTAIALAIIFTMAVGAMKEVFDAMAPGNRWDWGDIRADAVGCFLGTAAGVLLWLC